MHNTAQPQIADINDVGKHLSAIGVSVSRNVRLSDTTYLRTGGVACIIIEPYNILQLSETISLLENVGAKYKIIGNTSNLLFKDDTAYSILISTLKVAEIRYDADNRQIVADCGVMMPKLSRVALWNDVTGFEGLEGIPGTIGGGIFMNAGAYGVELKDNLVSAVAIRPDGAIETIDPTELGLTHRASALRRGKFRGVVAQCTFKATPGNSQEIFRKMESFHAKRHKYQDFMYPNIGSIFSGSPYRALAEKDMYFKVASSLFYLFRYKVKIFHRESPINRKWLNEIVMKRFDFSYKIQPFSDKTLNCLVNRGQGTDEMIRFIKQLEKLIDGRAPLENEIVDKF